MSILTDMNLIKFFKNIIDRNSKNIINGILLIRKFLIHTVVKYIRVNI